MQDKNTLFSIDFDKSALPDGKGGLAGISGLLEHQAFTGSGSYKIPIDIPQSRSLTPDLSIQYSSSAGNGIYGMGFIGPEHFITRVVSYGVPCYKDELDCFALEEGTQLIEVSQKTDENGSIWKLYKPEIESSFHKIEYIKEKEKKPYWKVTTAEHNIYYYGMVDESRLEKEEGKVFRWFLDFVEKPNGEKIQYQYKKICGYIYLTAIFYGNYFLEDSEHFAYEIFFDYGNWDIQGEKAMCTDRELPVRKDSYYNFRGGFSSEIRYLCRNILIFYNFMETFQGERRLIKYVSFSYKEEKEASLLVGMFFYGLKYKNNCYIETQKQMPLQFSYSEFSPKEVKVGQVKDGNSLFLMNKEAIQVSLVDLYGDGIPGILTLYKTYVTYARNLGNGCFEQPVVLEKFPIYQLGKGTTCTIKSLEGNAKKQFVIQGENYQGYYLLENETFRSFESFQAIPVEIKSLYGEYIDMNARGMSDLLVCDSMGERFYPSIGKDGFEKAISIQPSIQMPQINQDLRIYTTYAKVFGDGLYHKLWVEDNEIFCMPNFGHGQFGEKRKIGILSDISDFRASQVYLADLNGSGTQDFIYAEKDYLNIYFNQNGQYEEKPYKVPLPEHFTSDDILLSGDLFGQGNDNLIFISRKEELTCWFWDFTRGKKPYLLETINNHMGKKEKFSYASSVDFYLEDKKRGIKWNYQPQFPVQVVKAIQYIDEIAKNQITEEYWYHNSYYDNEKKIFCGFQNVECLKSYEKSQNCMNVFSKKIFYTGNPSEFDEKKSIAECRSVRGKVQLEEQYGIEHGVVKENFDWRKEYKYFIKKVDVKEVYFSAVNEVLHIIKKGTNEPRISQNFVLKFDEFGFPIVTCEVFYGRKTTDKKWENSCFDGQRETILYFKQFHYAHLTDAYYSLGIPIEEKEIGRSDLTPKEGDFFTAEELNNIIPVSSDIDNLQTLRNGNISNDIDTEIVGECNLLSWKRWIYWDSDLKHPLGFGEVSFKRQLHHEEIAVFSDFVADTYYKEKLKEEQLLEDGYYKEHGYYWRKSDTYYYSSKKELFNQLILTQYEDWKGTVFSKEELSLDKYALFCIEKAEYAAKDKKAVTKINIDYYTGQPIFHWDKNENKTEFEYNAFLEPVKIVFYGKEEDEESLELSFVYKRELWEEEKKPLAIITTKKGLQKTKQQTFQYYDGFGEEILKKTLVLDGRYLGDGFKVYNGEGKIIEQFSPFYSETEEFEIVKPKYASETCYYNSNGNVYKKQFYRKLPETEEYYTVFERTEYTPWLELHYDVNDTVKDSEYYKKFIEYWNKEAKKEIETKDQKKKNEKWKEEYNILEAIKLYENTPSIRCYNSRGQIETKIEICRTHKAYKNYKACKTQKEEMQYLVTREYHDIFGNCSSIELPVTYQKNEENFSSQASFSNNRMKNIEKFYDMEGHLLFEENKDSGSHLYFYNAKGLLLYKWESGEICTTMQYDWLGRVIKKQTGTMSETYIYGEMLPLSEEEIKKRNLWGNIAIVQSDFEKIEYESYNRLEQCEKERIWLLKEEQPLCLSSSYDIFGQLLQKTFPDNRTKFWEYDFCGRVQKSGIKSEEIVTTEVSMEYEPIGVVSKITFSNGIVHEKTYDPVTHLLQQDVIKRQKSDKQKELLWKDEFYFDLKGNPVLIKRKGEQLFRENTIISPEQRYCYDSVYRLETATGRQKIGAITDANQVETYKEYYTYDANSNLTARKRTGSQSNVIQMTMQDNSNRCSTISYGQEEYTLSYDERGNTIEMPGIHKMDWNELGEVIQFQVSKENSLVQTQSYSSGGVRRKKEIKRLRTEDYYEIEEIVYIGDYQRKRIWKETTKEKNLMAEYSSITLEADTEKIVEFSQKTEHRFSVKKKNVSTLCRYISGNYLSSAVLMTDKDGKVTLAEEYYPYGGTSYLFCIEISEQEKKLYDYMGKEKDIVTGLSYFGSRYYSPFIMRWISVDNTEEDGYNLYCFVGGNPIRYVDKDGRCKVVQIGDMVFREGDLLYGLSEEPGRGPFWDEISEQLAVTSGISSQKLLKPITIDEYNNMFLGTGWGEGEKDLVPFKRNVTLTKGYDPASENLVEDFAKYLTKKRSDIPIEASLEAMNKRIEIACLEGVSYVYERERTIHYILDGIDMNRVLDPSDMGFTNLELRYIFNNRKKIGRVVRFYHSTDTSDCLNTIRRVLPPWFGKEEEWERRINPSRIRRAA